MILIDLDLSVARTDELHSVGAREVTVAQADDEAELRAGEPTSDLIPALPTLLLAAAPGERMAELYITNPAGAGRLVILAVR